MSKITDNAVKMLKFYASRRISRSSAALAYYITLSVFPFVICLNTAAANLNVTLPELLDYVRGVVPAGFYDLMLQHISYISENDSKVLFTGALLLMITTSASAYRVLMSSIKDCVGEVRYSGIKGFVFSFILSVCSAVVIYLALFIIISGKWLFELFMPRHSAEDIYNVWKSLRFVILFLILYVFITSLNLAAIRQRRKKSFALMSVSFFTAVVLVLVSAAFSLAIELSSRYTLIYGSIASVIVLMLWLYFCGNVLISGCSICGYFTRREIEKNL